jgi:hypothetical protein
MLAPVGLGQPLGRAELVRVGIDDDVGSPVGADREQADQLLVLVPDLVGALLASGKADYAPVERVCDPAGVRSEGVPASTISTSSSARWKWYG